MARLVYKIRRGQMKDGKLRNFLGLLIGVYIGNFICGLQNLIDTIKWATKR